jgi:hypothetical protein
LSRWVKGWGEDRFVLAKVLLDCLPHLSYKGVIFYFGGPIFGISALFPVETSYNLVDFVEL